MGERVRWPLWPPGSIQAEMSLHFHLLAVLALLYKAAACSFREPGSQATNVSAAPNAAKQLAQGVENVLCAALNGAESYLRDTYGRVRDGRLELSVIAWLGALVCAIQAFVLWKMTAAAPNSEREIRVGRETSDRPSSLWAAWKIDPEMGKYFSSMSMDGKASTSLTVEPTSRSRNKRSGPPPKILKLQIVQDLNSHLPIDPNVLQAAWSGRQASQQTYTIAAACVRPWLRGMFGLVQSNSHEPDQHRTMPRYRPSRLWEIEILSNGLERLYPRSAGRATRCRH